MATYKDSQKQETHLAKQLGGFRNSGSGSGWIRKSDIRTQEELIEAKITSAKSYSLKDAELSQNNDYAIVDGRMPVFVVEFKTTGNRWAILSWDDYLTLRESADNFGNEITNSQS
jgi:hypothetical protein